MSLHVGYLRQYSPKTYFMNCEVPVLRFSSKIIYKKKKTITSGTCVSIQHSIPRQFCDCKIWATVSETVPLDVCPKQRFKSTLSADWSESLLGTFWIAKYATFLHVDNKDWSDCMNVQADLSLCWRHKSEGRFSYVVTCFSVFRPFVQERCSASHSLFWWYGETLCRVWST